MKSTIATILTMVLLVAGTGGAIAIGASGSSGGAQGGAACGQYNPGHQKNGKPCKRQNCGKHHNQPCPVHTKHKAKHGKKSHKPASKKPKAHKPSNSSCTIKKQGQLTVVYCP